MPGAGTGLGTMDQRQTPALEGQAADLPSPGGQELCQRQVPDDGGHDPRDEREQQGGGQRQLRHTARRDQGEPGQGDGSGHG
ncbi:MAG TPA: hypothetical protein VMC03_14695, partial [Streptosporangiaceae bacterium]|nr:hypothetical protein [Streptosporangiaceae bacterium]